MTGEATPLIPQGPYKLGLEEYRELPDDGRTYQIIDGELYATPAPTLRHQRISKRLLLILAEALEASGQGEVFHAPTDVVLDRHNVVQSDLLFVRADRLERMGEDHIEGPPDLVIEILSPSSRRTDVLVKSRTYARFGVPHSWIADPELDRLEMHRLEGDRYTHLGTFSKPEVVEPEAFPGLRIPLDRVF